MENADCIAFADADESGMLTSIDGDTTIWLTGMAAVVIFGLTVGWAIAD